MENVIKTKFKNCLNIKYLDDVLRVGLRSTKVVFLKLRLLAADTIYYYQSDDFFMDFIAIFKRIPMH
jgi:hypothetical protein